MNTRFITRFTSIIALTLGALFLTSCGAGKVAVPDNGSIRFFTDKGWVQYMPTRPDWVTNPGNHISSDALCFVGISLNVTDESVASNDAYKDVANKIAGFISTDSGKKLDQIMIMKGMASEVLDPAVKQQVALKQVSIADVKSAYTASLHTERSQEYRHGMWNDTKVKMFIKVLYPKAKLAQVEQELVKAQQAKIQAKIQQEKDAKKKELLLEADKELEKLKNTGF